MAVSALSCSDEWLTDTPTYETLITENGTIVTESDLIVAVNGLYGVMNTSSTFGANHFTYQELTGDLAFVGISNSGRFTGTNGWGHISPDEGAGTAIWNSLYNIIANANFILAYEDQIEEDTTVGNESVKQLFAHVHAVRAYCYTTLMQYFAPNYGEGDQSLGVPYVTTFDVEQRLPRSTVQEVYDNILADLNYAEDNFVTNPGKNTFNPVTIKLLKARVYLYMKNYPKAIEYADQVINDGSTSFVGLSDVSKIFVATNEDNYSEILFQIYESSTVNLGSNDALSATWSSVGTYKQNYMRESFYKTFIPKTNPDDPNGEWPRSQWISKATDMRAKSWYIVNAYVNNLTDDPKPVDVRKYTGAARDVVQFRKSEAIFIKAEAQYKEGSDSDAAQTLQNWVVTYRDPGYVIPATSGSVVLDEILRQKGFEFFLEGHRFTDMKRNNRAIDKTGQNSNSFIAPADDYKFVWPIPLTEMQTNPNMVQNPGY